MDDQIWVGENWVVYSEEKSSTVLGLSCLRKGVQRSTPTIRIGWKRIFPEAYRLLRFCPCRPASGIQTPYNFRSPQAENGSTKHSYSLHSISSNREALAQYAHLDIANYWEARTVLPLSLKPSSPMRPWKEREAMSPQILTTYVLSHACVKLDSRGGTRHIQKMCLYRDDG